jgi:hypothetical protein
MAPPQVLALVFCDAAARDASGKITLYGIFDTVYSERFPAVHGQLSVYWKCSVSEKGRIVALLEGEDGGEVFRSEPTEVEPKGEAVQAQAVLTLLGATFPTPGTYHLKLLYNGVQELARASLRVERPARVHQP